MIRMVTTPVLLVVLVLVPFGVLSMTAEDQAAKTYLDGYDARVSELYTQYTQAAWNYNTNLTTFNQQKQTELSLEYAEFSKNESKEAAKFNQSAMTDESLKRQLDMLTDVGISGYDDVDTLRRISELNAELESLYSSGKWCKTPNDCKSLDPDLTDILTTSRNYDELRDVWEGWRDASGAKMRQKYEEFVRLMNVAIKDGGRYSDMGEYYRSWYEQPTFEQDVKNLFEQLSPLYDQLQAYVRRKLRLHYGAENFPSSGHIPAHLLGNMWAQQWNNIYDLLEPYPGKSRPGLTDAMKAKNYTIRQMYETAEEFFTSIGMKPMPESFWRLSMLERPNDGREVVCHASAWDFSNGTDFRIKQCTSVTEDQMITVHHEMGHVEYYLEYIDQPFLFRGGANPGMFVGMKFYINTQMFNPIEPVNAWFPAPSYQELETKHRYLVLRIGFHEGVADIVSLSFQTPEHLMEIGLLDSLPDGQEGDINFLFLMALDKVAFLPFGYLIDQWRWSVYRGDTTPENYNRDWWDLRCQYQGIAPPVERSEDDFDPGAKFHIPGNTPYIRYFVSYVAQFQWHKALCELIGQNETLHRCDIYRNRTAGARLQEMLQMGSSRPWGEAMRTITRGTSGETDKLDAGALLGYFEPLRQWLADENARADEQVGWDKKDCPSGSFRMTSGSPVITMTSLSLFLISFVSLLLSM